MKFLLFILSITIAASAAAQIRQAYEDAGKIYRRLASTAPCQAKKDYYNRAASFNECWAKKIESGSGNCPASFNENEPDCSGATSGSGSSTTTGNRTNNTSSDNKSAITSNLVESAMDLTFGLINSSKRNKWNKEKLRRADEFQSRYGITVDALEEAVDRNDTTSLKAMIAKGIDLNIDILYDDHTLLFYATNEKKVDIVKILLEANVDVNKACPKTPDRRAGLTPLHSAAFNGNLEIVKLLVEKGANIEAELDFWNLTPIFMAIQNNKLNVIIYLIEKNANLSHKGKWEPTLGPYLKLTPEEYAKKMKNNEAVKILRGY